jgi:hypothetical protein
MPYEVITFGSNSGTCTLLRRVHENSRISGCTVEKTFQASKKKPCGGMDTYPHP